MVEGVSYRKQTGIAGGSIPDITFFMPGGRMLHMDVKFPVDNYLRHLEAGTDHERDATAKAFVRDVRNRVKELSGRQYVDASTTLDEVLLFIPNESVWAFIQERDPQLIDLAMGQKVVLCSPVSLFAVLAVIRQAVEQTRLTRTSDEILECLGGFRAQWQKYAEAVDAAPYVSCAADYPTAYAAPTGWTASVTSIAYWDRSSKAFGSTCASGSVQLVSLSVRHGTDVTESLQVVKRQR